MLDLVLRRSSRRRPPPQLAGLHRFEVFLGSSNALVVVGRFDRMNLLASSAGKRWSIFDNVSQKIVATGEFNGVPIEALGSADGKYAYVAFADAAEVAIVDLEDPENEPLQSS